MSDITSKLLYDSEKLVKGRRKIRGALTGFFRLVVLLSIGFIIIYPLFYMLSASVAGKYAFTNSSRVWIPSEFNIVENYRVAFDCLDYGKALLATLEYGVLPGLIQVFSCSLAAYGMARFDYFGKKIMLAFLFITIMIPDMVFIIPKMVNFSRLDFAGILGLIGKLAGKDIRPNLLDSVWAFLIPALLGVGLRSGILIFIYMQFFKGLPAELEEAAWVDGAGPFRTFLSIAVPSSGVVIITVTVFSLIWHWNDLINTAMLLTNKFTLSLMLDGFAENLAGKHKIFLNATNPEAMSYSMAACVLFVLPMLLFYMIVQKGFIESIDRVGITG